MSRCSFLCNLLAAARPWPTCSRPWPMWVDVTRPRSTQNDSAAFSCLQTNLWNLTFNSHTLSDQTPFSGPAGAFLRATALACPSPFFPKNLKDVGRKKWWTGSAIIARCKGPRGTLTSGKKGKAPQDWRLQPPSMSIQHTLWRWDKTPNWKQAPGPTSWDKHGRAETDKASWISFAHLPCCQREQLPATALTHPSPKESLLRVYQKGKSCHVPRWARCHRIMRAETLLRLMSHQHPLPRSANTHEPTQAGTLHCEAAPSEVWHRNCHRQLDFLCPAGSAAVCDDFTQHFAQSFRSKHLGDPSPKFSKIKPMQKWNLKPSKHVY